MFNRQLTLGQHWQLPPTRTVRYLAPFNPTHYSVQHLVEKQGKRQDPSKVVAMVTRASTKLSQDVENQARVLPGRTLGAGRPQTIFTHPAAHAGRQARTHARTSSLLVSVKGSKPDAALLPLPPPTPAKYCGWRNVTEFASLCPLSVQGRLLIFLLSFFFFLYLYIHFCNCLFQQKLVLLILCWDRVSGRTIMSSSHIYLYICVIVSD